MWDKFNFADEQGDECCDELFIDPIEGGSIAEVKRINSWKFYEKLKQDGFPPGYQVLCKNCLAKKYKVSPHEFDFVQTFGDLDEATDNE